MHIGLCCLPHLQLHKWHDKSLAKEVDQVTASFERSVVWRCRWTLARTTRLLLSFLQNSDELQTKLDILAHEVAHGLSMQKGFNLSLTWICLIKNKWLVKNNFTLCFLTDNMDFELASGCVIRNRTSCGKSNWKPSIPTKSRMWNLSHLSYRSLNHYLE